MTGSSREEGDRDPLPSGPVQGARKNAPPRCRPAAMGCRTILRPVELTASGNPAVKQQVAVTRALILEPKVLHIEVSRDRARADCIEGVVTESAYMGPVIEYSVKTAVGALFTRGPAYETQYMVGERVQVRIRPDEIIVIPGNSA